jgi:hypothetical protein
MQVGIAIAFAIPAPIAIPIPSRKSFPKEQGFAG